MTDRDTACHEDNNNSDGKCERQTFSLEQTELISRRHRLSLKTAVKYKSGAICASWLSVVCGLIQSIVSFVLAGNENSSSLLGFGLDALLDSASSVVVLWRFYSLDVYSEAREKRACFLIGLLFFLASLFLTGQSIYDLITDTKTIPTDTLMALYVGNGVLNLCIASLKIYLGYNLESMALVTDSIITYIGSAMSFAGLAALEAYIHYSKLWYLDSVIGLVCCAVMYMFSIRLMCHTASTWSSNDT